MKNKFANKKNQEKPKKQIRIKAIKFLFCFCLFAISARAFQIQNFSGEKLKNRTTNIYSKKIVLDKKRGAIFDRNGEVLAMSVDAWDIGIRPGFKKNFTNYKRLSQISGIPQEKIIKKFNSKSVFTFLKRKVSSDEVNKIKSLVKRSGADKRLFEFVKTHKRVYPNRTLAAPVIGFSNLQNVRTGIEKKFNPLLEGEKVEIPIVSVGKGNWYTDNMEFSGAKPGKDIYLTIDKKIQHITEKALQRGIEKFNAKDGKAIVMDPSTGEILAMAQYPFFNPNSYGKYEPRSWYNRHVFDAFEPGSIMKIFLVAGAIEDEYCTENSIFFCENGSYKIGPATIHDTKSHKWLQVSDIIKYSSNIGATRIAEVVGNKPFYNILKNFGFGEKTGIDVSIETSGKLRDPSKWTKIDASNISFGQGLAASSVQIVTAASAIVNDGKLLKPILVKKVVDSNGKIYSTSHKKVRKTILSETTAKTVKEMMRTVVEDGTGKNARPTGYHVGGKTGTSQKLEKDGTYSRQKYLATFLGFAPLETPRLVVLVAINEPKDQYYGGIVAAPVFREITSKTLRYLNVVPSSITFASNEENHGS